MCQENVRKYTSILKTGGFEFGVGECLNTSFFISEYDLDNKAGLVWMSVERHAKDSS